MIPNRYPLKLPCRGNINLIIRPLEEEDIGEVVRFMRSLPEEERVYFWDDPTQPEVIRRWIRESQEGNGVALIGSVGEKIITLWTLSHDRHSWTRHIGYLWGIVDPAYRRQGVATVMVRELLNLATHLDIERVALELIRPQKGQIGHFTHLGFEMIAVLRDWVKDPNGQYHDMIIISMEVEPAWRK
ncbi:MAG: GNAT family N-acetyltransferase, partial [bacterium]